MISVICSGAGSLVKPREEGLAVWGVLVTLENGERFAHSEWVRRQSAIRVARRLNRLKGISAEVPDETGLPGFVDRLAEIRKGLNRLLEENAIDHKTCSDLRERALNASRIEELERVSREAGLSPKNG